MGALDGRVAVITGAGRGLGREHALLFAAEGARVVVNDLGGGPDGSGRDTGPAAEVAAEIRAGGGEAVASSDDITTAEGAAGLVEQAIDAFGALHVLVNNAGILRDRTIINMTDAEWDDVIRVHLRGHFMPLRAAARYWREQSKAGQDLRPSLINTTSTSGLFNNPGQANYGAAKTGIATLTVIAQRELGRYGVRANAIAPAARTRLTLATPGIPDAIATTPDAGFDPMDPANVSPFVAYLATAGCPIQGRVFFVAGGGIHLFQPFAIIDGITKDGQWTVAELQDAGGPAGRRGVRPGPGAALGGLVAEADRLGARGVGADCERGQRDLHAEGHAGRVRVDADDVGLDHAAAVQVDDAGHVRDRHLRRGPVHDRERPQHPVIGQPAGPEGTAAAVRARVAAVEEQRAA